MSRRHAFLLVSLLLSLFLAILVTPGCSGDPATAPDDEARDIAGGGPLIFPDNTPTGFRSGGRTTVFQTDSGAFEQPAPNLRGSDLALHEEGDESFDQDFVASPAAEHQGLGPIFNRASCSACHIGDGRGRAPLPGEEVETMLLRLSVPGIAENGGPVGAPGFGGQLQDRGIPGIPHEAKISLAYTPVLGTYGDGTPYALQRPTFDLSDTYIPYPSGLLISPRVAPSVFGLGLLEALPEAAILARSDPNDANHDGISGRPNYVFDPLSGSTVLGRFGWKANTGNLHVQSAAAYNNDMGVTSSIFTAETCAGQSQMDEYTDDPELDDDDLLATTFYTQTLAVPARRDILKLQVRRGEKNFQSAGCAACHAPVHLTGASPVTAALSFNRIQPFTDLLLHDMGPELADNRPDFLASGSEWRTAPLWGIGLQEAVNGHTNFLHDGRARDLSEAILWHGGEATAAREKFRKASKFDRDALLAFLNSL